MGLLMKLRRVGGVGGHRTPMSLVAGDLNPSQKYEFVNGDDEIPNINGKITHGNQTTNQFIVAGDF